MTKKYTDEQVEALVKEVGGLLDFLNEGGTVGMYTGYTHQLNHHYAPFKPDPEEELIEAMAQADYNSWRAEEYAPKWDEADGDIKSEYRKSARVVLAVVKEKGLPQ